MVSESWSELGPQMIGRTDDVARVLRTVADAECCSVVGVSNIGKSTLLRALALPAVVRNHAEAPIAEALFVYVDFNLTLQLTEQGFYEVILRCLLATLKAADAPPELVAEIQKAYQEVITASSPMLMALAFEQSMEALMSQPSGWVVLLLDEFDEVFAGLDSQILVRLRALKERKWSRLCYVTATDRPLANIRWERQVGEFCELFDGHSLYLGPLTPVDASQFVDAWSQRSDVKFTRQETNFVMDCAGGHPGLMQATLRFLRRTVQERSWRPEPEDDSRLRQELAGDASVRLECAKLWTDLTGEEQETLLTWLDGSNGGHNTQTLEEKGILRESSQGKVVFGCLFAGFVRRQSLVRRREPLGVRVDVESGDVWVDGTVCGVLTGLEYKLLLLLYGNLNKIVDKYHIVEGVWGENYIDEVDDARIEKLISRLREKLEPGVKDSRYLTTVRGRGYRLVSPE